MTSGRVADIRVCNHQDIVVDGGKHDRTDTDSFMFSDNHLDKSKLTDLNTETCHRSVHNVTEGTGSKPSGVSNTNDAQDTHRLALQHDHRVTVSLPQNYETETMLTRNSDRIYLSQEVNGVEIRPKELVSTCGICILESEEFRVTHL